MLLAVKLAKKIVRRNGLKPSQNVIKKLSSRRISTQPYTATILHLRRKFHASPKPRWSTPEDLSVMFFYFVCFITYYMIIYLLIIY